MFPFAYVDVKVVYVYLQHSTDLSMNAEDMFWFNDMEHSHAKGRKFAAFHGKLSALWSGPIQSTASTPISQRSILILF